MWTGCVPEPQNRLRAFCRGGVPAPPGGWGLAGRNSPVCSCMSLRWCCCFHPISLVLPKETGWSPKEKRLWGGGAPVRFRDPPASPTRVGAATRPLRCPLRGRIESLAPGARGLGWQKSSQAKVFCPAFLQKSGRGPGAEPMDARRSARNSPCAHKAQEGVKGGTLAGGPPFAGGSAARSPRDTAGPAVDEGKGRRGRRPLRRAGNGPRAAGFTARSSHARAGAGGTR